jgi:hypothetical protein
MILVCALMLGLQGRGGPPPVYRTDVPASPLNVIAGAPTKTSVILSIQSQSNATVDIAYQAAGGRTAQVKLDLAAGKPSELPLSNLKPDSDYTYTVTAGTEKVNGRFHTARETNQTFTFDIQADSHLDGNSGLDVYQRTLQNIVKDKPDFLVDLGDTFMVDKYPNYQDSLKQYQAQRYWFSIPGTQMPVFLCLGNHDGEVGWRARGGSSTTEWSQQQRQTYFPVIRPDSFYSGAPKRGLYYSWTWGDAQFTVLDPFVATIQKTRNDEDGWNWTLGAEQFKWFESTLKSSKAKYKFVFIHHLVGGFGKEARGGTEAIDRFEWGDTKGFPEHRTGWAEPIHSLMVKYGVTALFHGHDHLYVRQERDGITYLEVPQPSHSRGDSTSSAKEYGYTTGTLLGSSGHIRVTVSPETIKIEYVKSLASERNGDVVDQVVLKPKK